MRLTSFRRALTVLLALAAVAATVPGTAPARGHHDGGGHRSDETIEVMTRNLYLGTDLLAIAAAPTLEEFKQRAAAGFAQVEDNDFPARARLIADEIKRTRPDLIGLQEVALWRTGPEDGISGNAEDVAYDYLEILERALERRGLDYEVAQVGEGADFEGPTSEGFDLRLTMRDAVLVNDRRRGLGIEGAGSAPYSVVLTVPTAAGPFTSTRGYTYVDVTLGDGRRHRDRGPSWGNRWGRGERRHSHAWRRDRYDGPARSLRFVNTHLQAFVDPIRVAQAAELVGPTGPIATKDNVVLVGDVNSDPNGLPGGSEPGAWNVIVGAGLIDAWPLLNPGDSGYTCCVSDPGLGDPPRPSPFSERIDDVFVKGALRPQRSHRTGTRPRRTWRKPPIWASDHTGVVTKLRAE